MTLGREFIGKSNKRYLFVRVDVTETASLPGQGGLFLAIQNHPDQPAFICTLPSLRDGLAKLDKWPKVGLLADDCHYYIMACRDWKIRTAAVADLLAHYDPPLNRAPARR